METKGNIQYNILVVDDNPKNIQVLGSILKEAGYLFGYAVNGKNALMLLRNSNDYDLVLLDVDMPEMNGYDACVEMRKDEKLKEIPVIFLTAYADVENVVKGFDVGAQDYVVKPFNAKELLARVDTQLQLKYKTDQIKEINKILNGKNKDITDSITYASYIQEAILPTTDHLKRDIADLFFLYQPKDILSGDFYWFKKINNILYIAAGDCTGHGIPGAFLSILGIMSLNEVISDNKIHSPNIVLKKLRNRIKKTLNQFDKVRKNHDGMDMALCMIDFDKMTLEYAGAYNPLYLIRKKEENDSSEFIIKKADKMPLGIHPNDAKDFTNHIIDIKKGDTFYIFSDGYISQFGGEKSKQYSSLRFQNLLLSIQDKTMPEQKDILEKSINDWRKNLELIDDILVIGLRF